MSTTKRNQDRRKYQHEGIEAKNPRKRHRLHSRRRLLCAGLEAAGGTPSHWQVGQSSQGVLRQFCPALYSTLVLSGELHTYLADLNEQATERCSLIIEQMAEAEGVDEAMKAENQMLWVQSMNSIRSRAEEIIMHELIYD